jgi:diguanylate cyclase (GGDEF)-like protein
MRDVRTLVGQALSPILVIGAIAILVGAVVGAGWLLHDPDLVRVGMSSEAVVLVAALCFMLSGLGLVLSGGGGVASRIAVEACAVLLVILSGAMLAESLFGVDLGIDLTAFHRWVDDGNPAPGRVSPIASPAFVVCGLVLLLLRRATGRIGAGLVELLVFVQIVLGIVGLLSNWLDIDALYGWQDAAPVTIPAGIVLILLGIGTWLRFHAPDAERTQVRREEWHLTIVAGEILAVIALIAGLSAFAILQRTIEATFADSLDDNLADRRRSFENAIRDAMQANAMVANRPVLARVVDEFNTGAGESARAQLQASAHALLAFGYKHVSYLDPAGTTIASAGPGDTTFDLTVRLNAVENAWLAWGERGFVLAQDLPMLRDGRVVGRVVAERYMTALTAAYHNVAHIGVTADSRICALPRGGTSCFPSALSPVIVATDALQNLSVGMTRALNGNQGRVTYKDYRGQDVVAAYGPIGTLGLGAVLKVDVYELYAPIRRELEIVAPILLLLVAAGTLCLRVEITPLARRLRELATVDGLTGALNRRAFLRFAENELAIARRYGRPLSVMMLDADHFKMVNDVHGHDAGDAVLRAFAATCRKHLRDVDLLGRLGGEEFAVALPETALTPAHLVAERLRRELAKLEVAIGSKVLKFTVSIGLASLTRPSDTIETLLKAADQALYASKLGGRNRVTVASDEPVPTAAEVALPAETRA